MLDFDIPVMLEPDAKLAMDLNNPERVFSPRRGLDRSHVNQYATSVLKQRHSGDERSLVQLMDKTYAEAAPHAAEGVVLTFPIARHVTDTQTRFF
jgi:hypothetical protein